MNSVDPSGLTVTANGDVPSPVENEPSWAPVAVEILRISLSRTSAT
jgi:hypothetical protein